MTVRRTMGLLLGLALLLTLSAAPALAADESDFTSDNVVLLADEVRYDQALQIVTASGNVEISSGGRILKADTISYNQQADVVTATGNIVMLQPSGEVLFSDYVELSGDLKSGVIKGIRILLDENTRVAANGARRTGNITEMSKGVFSPCDLCEDDPNAAPFWQIKAVKIVHNQDTHDIEYYDAYFEAFGTPILYTPYLTHPDPTVKRRSGFLTPSYGSNSNLGFILMTPYYFNLAPNRDATFTPMILTDAEPVFIGEYRALTGAGAYNLEGSVTYTDAVDSLGNSEEGKAFRWALKGDGLWDYDETWRYGFDLYRASDDTYLDYYDFDNEDTLTSDVFIEGFRDRSYASAFGYVFQGLLEEDNQDEIPVVAPWLTYQRVTDPGEDGSFFTLDSSLLALTREVGVDMQRVSLAGAYEQPYLTDSGHVFTFRGSLRVDGYNVRNLDTGGSSLYDGATGRVWPVASAEWRYPLVRDAGNFQQFFEPIVMGVISPNGGNPDEIPNEDSQDFEFDDINLFSENRFPGLDRVEGGARLNYGIRFGAFGNNGGRTEVLIGQVYQANVDDTFAPGSGLDKHFSDYVGRVLVSPADYLDLLYRFRLDNDGLDVRRSEIGFSAGPDWFTVSGSYIHLKDDPDAVVDTNGERQQFYTSADFEFSDEWSFNADWRQDLTGEGTIYYGGGLTFENECIIIEAGARRRFFNNRDVTPDVSILFTITLKSLG